MTGQHMEFDRRVRRLTKKHEKMSRGYRMQLRSDGLVVMRPRRVRSAIPIRVLALCVCAFFAFKALLLTTIGVSPYDERVQRLRDGTPVEVAGAWVMQREPVSEFLASKFTQFMY
ncbi:hypothetical protein AVO45_05050 [Ruegeria marisrubri]|uniref:Uncharacterized protein n=1 Tax=Ruegeria marisrubri TaxID=1685379 RepID=A0A0X3TZ06_9RHOB|nr:hypothetical protein [Ruegeria marisrubri]KUJ80917.1 hypothetical protein AVO45_05050 [Ruegeria marisrubri]